MRCFDCQTENDQGSKFCKNCGRSFFKKNPAAKPPHAQTTYPHQEGVQALTALRSRKFQRAMWVMAPGLLALAADLATGGKMIGVTLIMLVVSVSIAAWIRTIKEADYSALPGARDDQGQHRCIHCGNRGIWKRTPYKTNTTIAACSKCKTDLYHE